MATYFISDLHVHESAPEIAEQLLSFLHGEALQADALYILGDLFETWVGDDDDDRHYEKVCQALRAFTDTGVKTYFMHGNRDFLIGPAFCQRTGIELLADPCVHNIEGEDVLLSHGDAYCTDDHEYQTIRKQLRDPQWQSGVLQLPLEQRRAMAGDAREQSKAVNQQKSAAIMDVNTDAIEQALLAAGVTTLLHGHTHRPAIHELTLGNGKAARRIVLGDWYDQGSIGIWDEDGFRLEVRTR